MHNYRNLMRVLLAAATAALSACSYDATKPDLIVHVNGLPANAVRAAVTVTGNGDSAVYHPKFGAAAGASQDFAFGVKAGSYAVTVAVVACDSVDNQVGGGTVTSAPTTFPATPPLELTVPVTAAAAGSCLP